VPWNLFILAAVLLGVGVLLFFLTCLAMAKVLLSPERMTGGRALSILRRLSPAEIGLPSEDLWFDVRDERAGRRLQLAAWWIPAPGPSPRTAVIVHGYSDSKIGGIAWAPTFRALGFNVLAVDLRAHGESDGAHTTAGFFERHDLSQVIDQVRAARPAETRDELILFGVSLGAAVVGATAALRECADVDAVIMDCPFRDYLSAARTHARAQGLPGKLFQAVALDWARRLSKADFDLCAPVRVIPALACPLMVIHGEADLFVDPVDMRAVEAACRRRPPEWVTEYWEAADTHHVLALRTDPVEFRRRIEAFLGAARRRRGARVTSSTRSPAEVSQPS
jgi:pimeloyl-ACP methyl ester carboxylesterase